MPEETIVQLVESVLNGDDNAFTSLVKQHQSVVFNLARQNCPRSADAEDIAQDAFVRAYRNLRKLRNPARFSSWLYGITVNVAREHARKRPAFVPLDSVPEPAAPKTDNAVSDKENKLLAAISRLPEKYRIPLTLRYTNKMKYRAIGEALGLDEKTARTRVHRARTMLRAALTG